MRRYVGAVAWQTCLIADNGGVGEPTGERENNAFRHGRTGRTLVRDGWTSPEGFRLSILLRRTFGVDWPGGNRQTFLPPNVHSAAVLSHMNGGSKCFPGFSAAANSRRRTMRNGPAPSRPRGCSSPRQFSWSPLSHARSLFCGNCSSHALIGVNLMKLYGECALSLTQWVEVALEWPRPDVIGQLVGSAYT